MKLITPATILMTVALSGCAMAGEPSDAELDLLAEGAALQAESEELTCTVEPTEEVPMSIDESYGGGSAESAVGWNCWWDYNRRLNDCERAFQACLRYNQSVPWQYRRNCGQEHYDCRARARNAFWNCVFYWRHWWCSAPTVAIQN